MRFHVIHQPIKLIKPFLAVFNFVLKPPELGSSLGNSGIWARKDYVLDTVVVQMKSEKTFIPM